MCASIPKKVLYNAFAVSLPKLKEMCVQILWLMPISVPDRKGKPGSYYAVQDYKAINVGFGNMQDWKKLVAKAHEMSFKVITDWVPRTDECFYGG